MADLHLWRSTPGRSLDEMRGTVPEETNYTVSWIFSALLSLAVIFAVWQLGF